MLEAGRESKIVKFQIYLKIVVGRRKSVARRCRVKSLRVSERAEESPFEPSKFFDSTPFSNLQVFRLQCLCWWEIDQSPFVNFIPRFEILLLHIDDSSAPSVPTKRIIGAEHAPFLCRSNAALHAMLRCRAPLTLRLAAGPKCERFCIPSLLRHQGISITSRNHAAFFPQLCGILSAIMQSTAFVWVKSVTGQPTVNSLSLPLGPSKQHP